MKEDLPWFTHDNDALGTDKMQALLAAYDFAGYGRFWALNERIAKSKRARLDLSTKVVKNGLAANLRLTPTELDAFLAFLADPEECGLIHYENGIVTTDRTQKDLGKVMAERKRDAGRRNGVIDYEIEEPAGTDEKPAGNDPKPACPPPVLPTDYRTLQENREEPLSPEAEFDEFAAAGKNPGRDTPVENSAPEEELPDFDPVPLRIPGNLKFSSKELADLRTWAGQNAQEAVDTYGRLKAKHGYRYANDFAGLQDFAIKGGGLQPWLDHHNGRTRTQQPEEGGRQETRRPVKAEEPPPGAFETSEEWDAWLAAHPMDPRRIQKPAGVG